MKNNSLKSYILSLCTFLAVLSVTMLCPGVVTQANAQSDKTITGVITSATDNSPLIGVAVMIKGTTVGVVTNAKGEYSISAKDNSTLAISYMGYVSQDIAVGARNKIDVSLAEDAQALEEVVVIGYGTMAKRSVSTAISSVDGSKISDMPVNNVAQGLVGLTSGITFQQISGQPGEAPAIRIRGAGSINSGNDPLYVIDGYPTNDAQLFTNLNPQDIESIDILKDAASAAIYGSRAGNGVIIVTTKRGKKDSSPNIRFDFQMGVSQPTNLVDVLGKDDYLDMVLEARKNSNTADTPEFLALIGNRANLPDINWQKKIFRNALNQRYNVSVNGGSEKIRYSFSANYMKDDGILLNSYNERISVKGSVDADLSKYVTMGFSFTPTYNKTRSQDPTGGNTENTTGMVADALTMPPIFDVYRDNGDYYQIAQHGKNLGFNSQLRNPVSKLMEVFNDTYSLRTINSAYIQIKPIKGLVLRSNVDVSTNSAKIDSYNSAYLPGSALTGNKSTPNLAAIGAYRNAGFGYNVYWSSTANYNLTVNNAHNFTALLGYDVAYNSAFSVRQDTRTDSSYPVAFDNTTITNVNGASLWNGSSNNAEYSFDAVFGRLNYDYKSRYLVSGSVRQDRSSKFGPGSRAGIFWSVSGAWNIAEENWAKKLDWLTMLKVRGSYGVTGNDQIGYNQTVKDKVGNNQKGNDRIGNYYAWISTLSNNYYAFGSGSDMTNVKTYYPKGYSNTDLGWEKNKQWDLGIDIGLFGRLNITVDAYKRTSDVVMNASIPNFNGKSGSIMMNSGQLENKGLEIQIMAPVLTGKFKWTTNLNYSTNRNKILSLADGMTQLSNGNAGTKWSNVMRNYVGRPMGDMYMYIVEGTFNTPEDLKKYAKKGSQAIGDLRFKDLDNNGSINTDDMGFVGNYQPKFTFGWTNNFSYKNFDLAFTLDGQYGGKTIWALARAVTLNRYDDNVTVESGLGRWRSPENPGNGSSHKAGTANLGSNIDASTRYLYDSDFLRIRNITIGYTLPTKIVSKIGIKGLRFNASVQNLHMFTNYPGYSPEANYNGNSATNNGVDFGCYPISRVITFGANVTF